MRSHIPHKSKITPPKNMTAYPTTEQIEESHRKSPIDLLPVDLRIIESRRFTVGDGIRLACGVWIFSLFVLFCSLLFWTIVFGQTIGGFFGKGLFR